MKVAGIIILITLGCLTVWLLVDTIIGIIRKVRYKKQHKNDEVDNTK